jgi:hypothetical protein
VQSFGQEYLGSIVSSLIGLTFFVVGLWGLWMDRRKASGASKNGY